MRLERRNNPLLAAFVLAFFELAAYITLEFVPRDATYYEVCIPFNLAIYATLGFLGDTRLVVWLRWLNVAAALVQCYGWWGYEHRYPVVIYNVAIHTITAVQVWQFFKDDKHGGRGVSSLASLDIYRYFCWRSVLHKEKNQ